MKIINVNEKDEIIGYKERGALESLDIYRVSALWIENSKEELKQNPNNFLKIVFDFVKKN